MHPNFGMKKGHLSLSKALPEFLPHLERPVAGRSFPGEGQSEYSSYRSGTEGVSKN
jgi:hypothetical protein